MFQPSYQNIRAYMQEREDKKKTASSLFFICNLKGEEKTICTCNPLAANLTNILLIFCEGVCANSKNNTPRDLYPTDKLINLQMIQTLFFFSFSMTDFPQLAVPNKALRGTTLSKYREGDKRLGLFCYTS